MKELIKKGPDFQIVESGSIVFSTPDGPCMVKYLSKTPGITHIRTIEPWGPSSVNVKEPE